MSGQQEFDHIALEAWAPISSEHSKHSAISGSDSSISDDSFVSNASSKRSISVGSEPESEPRDVVIPLGSVNSSVDSDSDIEEVQEEVQGDTGIVVQKVGFRGFSGKKVAGFMFGKKKDAQEVTFCISESSIGSLRPRKRGIISRLLMRKWTRGDSEDISIGEPITLVGSGW